MAFPTCSGCGRITKFRPTNPHPAMIKAGFLPKRCPNNDNGNESRECEAPPQCHGQVGIGVATLGTACYYPENHEGEHSYSGRRCNKHPEGCP